MSESANNVSVFVIDDEEIVRQSMTQTLLLDGYNAQAFENPKLAIAQCSKDWEGVIICDVRMNIMTGLDVLQQIMDIDSDIPVIMFSGHADIAMAVQAIHIGAYDFLEKTDDPEHHLATVQRAWKKRQLVLENRQLRKNLQSRNSIDYRLVGQTLCMQRLRVHILQLAKMDIDLIINGHTGTGKEVVAKCLHDFGDRQGQPFVAINCGALAESIIESELFGHEAGTFTGAVKQRVGKIEYANGGTLFLDEIESMPASVQVRLLRVLQERSVQRLGGNTEVPVDIRVVAATKVGLLDLVHQGRFREDLYYRLNVARIDLPDLAARKADVAILFNHFVQLYSLDTGREAPSVPHALLNQLTAKSWPGNVRELRNAAHKWWLGLPLQLTQEEEQPLVNGLRAAADLGAPFVANPNLSLDEHLADFEKKLIESALEVHHGHIERTANALQIPRKKLYLRMKKYHVRRQTFSA